MKFLRGKVMIGERTNSGETARTNNNGGLHSFELPEDIDNLIDACETYSPGDVWMEYLATLPMDTTKSELHRLRAQFVTAVAEYMGADE